MQELEKRVTRAEFTLTSHADQLGDLQEAFKGLRATLNGIQTVLLQIKWIAVGALIVVVLGDSAVGDKLLDILL